MHQNSSGMYSSVEFFNLCIFFFILLVEKSSAAHFQYEACVPKACGNLSIKFPFYIGGLQESYCGHPGFELSCSNSPAIHLTEDDYVIDNIQYENRTFRVHNEAVSTVRGCLPQIGNISEDSLLGIVDTSRLHLLSNCNSKLPEVLSSYKVNYCDPSNKEDLGLVMLGEDRNLNIALQECNTNVLAPVEVDKNGGNGIVDYEGLLRKGFLLNWTVADCSRCERSGGRCGFNETDGRMRCFCPDRPHLESCKPRKKNLKVILPIVLPISASIVIVLALLFIRHRKNKMNFASYFLSRNTSEPSSNLDLEGGSVYFGVPVFSYSELEEATNSFDASKELGDGGFGTVYFGKLRDGREVAVKRLYEHNFKRMEQFMNEIQILTRLRHRNLVTLYGCTSRRCRELLLVYEYIPNGTVADHLHGDRAKDKHLTWQHRMNVAIETADALAYLHNSDIIHRDVKTNNILLDHNFCVKVADFGLSRLFPNDVSHISTAPQGTPGYVDPEYHQCYQLTDKSDVYSFGVVLIELISSMPAVDISRHRHEINLANLAINRIQKCAFDELIDPSLEYKSDTEVWRMTTSVAELAFRCLQLEKDMRPKMEEVVETLKEIKNCKDTSIDKTDETDEKAVESRKATVASPESEDIVLLKNVKCPSSPNSVADVWASSSSTTSASR
ncbi:LEAF RUST 10 DISEASE-RESISTANCE LOCUS RECEPTOR-LIKE PROTEIN KINASE-like 1.2 isoform X1 [Coffea eugenioides]|uniref:LEAF RUST 10 DISEASE-RESISTANCE LOCUS RECEPTOR-LIKE PROTEIN KINASE-like 1.2 isoform X1 n=1 Tax=Coffea eugenioides TaxID=49369 RepID=UPI000F60A7B6|nr:LEAF RUST 10 DISEASE-RESISTANCE LOCUS RECEPTOR-LIKE PROTEIN KINASE-like 1.2 isoform X1 [Coffea eugenioides]